MGYKQVFRLKSFWIILSTSIILLFYQNCSTNNAGGFNSSSGAPPSTQCLNKIQSSNLVKIAKAHQLNCTSPANYSCESRQFSETFPNKVSISDFCIMLDADKFCVPNTVRHFNTSAARKIANIEESDFREGGDFNRNEANCNYFDFSNNMTLLRSEAETTELAIKNLVAKCIDAQQLRE